MKSKRIMVFFVSMVLSIIMVASCSNLSSSGKKQINETVAEWGEVVNYTASKPLEVSATLQKFVDRCSTEDVKSGNYTIPIPADVKAFVEGDVTRLGTEVTASDGAVWTAYEQSVPDLVGTIGWDDTSLPADTPTVMAYYVIRKSEGNEDSRDDIQHFTSARYFYDMDKITGLYADDNRGIWAVTPGGVTHIRMEKMGYSEKARVMSQYTEEKLSRRGMISDAPIDPVTLECTTKTDDNDGLWTAMYAMGQLYRYAVETDAAKKEEARLSATKAVEAVLLLANISARTGTVDYKIRALEPDSKHLTKEYLLKGKDYAVNTFPEGPTGYRGRVHPDVGAGIHSHQRRSQWCPTAGDPAPGMTRLLRETQL